VRVPSPEASAAKLDGSRRSWTGRACGRFFPRQGAERVQGFGPADTGRENAVPLKSGTGQNVQYVRVTMLGNQAADNGVDCAKGSGPSGCEFLDMTELIVHGASHQG
jgi:hypothetical protein